MSALSIDHHVLAAIVLLGEVIALVGGLYLAYDLFGAPGGPLRRLTEIVSNTALALLFSVVGYLALFLIVTRFNPGLIDAYGQPATLAGLLGLGAGMGVGGGVGYALNKPCQYVYVPRSASRRMIYGFVTGAEIGGFGCLFYPLLGLDAGRQLTATTAFLAGLAFNLANGYVTATVVARLVMRRFKAPPASIPELDRLGIAAGAVGGFTLGSVFGIGYWLTFHTDAISGAFFALSGAIIAAIGGGFIAGMLQRIEWRIAHLSVRRLGILGILLVVIGFAMQASNELVTLLDIHVH